MKKPVARAALCLALLCLALLCLAGCKRSNISPNLGPDLAHWKASGQADKSVEPRPSEIVPTAGGNFADALGFSTTLPTGGGLALKQSFAIDGWFGQLEFSAPAPDGGDDWLLVVRVASAGDDPLTSLYDEAHAAAVADVTLDGVAVSRRQSSAGCALDIWEKDGYQYTMHSNKLQGAIPEEVLAALVSGLDTAPAP